VTDTRGLILGELAVREKLLTEVQLDECVQQQLDERYQRPLGEIMIDFGFIERADLTALLERQRAAIADYEAQADTAQLFGRIAVGRGYVTHAQLAEAIRAQIKKQARGFDAKIGQVMLELGMLDLQRFWSIVSTQGDFQCGSCGRRLERPFFSGDSVLCDHCKSPAFTVTSREPGPRPGRKTKR
jgi:Zn finger protein HypA/HybF involved in hydrogenase expression